MALIHPSLFLLSWLRFKGALRQATRKLKTVKGALLYAFGLIVFLNWVPVWVFGAFRHPSRDLPLGLFESVNPGITRFCISALLLTCCVLALLFPGKKALIAFKMSEVDFLFPGPFSRRELLAHKLWAYTLRILPTALIFSLFLIRAPWMWLGAFLGSFLSLSLMLLFVLAINMMGQVAAVRLYTRTRRLAALMVAVLVVAGVWHALFGLGLGPLRRFTGSYEDLGDWLLKVVNSAVLRWVLMPFDVFSRTITATRLFPDLIIWGTAALGIDLGLAVLILRLDADYFESSMEVSQKMYEKLQRLRRHGTIPISTFRPRTNWSLPDFPALSGAGPLAWRQLLSALRSMSKPFLIVLVLLLVGIGIGIVEVPDDAPVWIVLGAVAGMLTFFFFPMMLGFDFRADLDNMELLKVLPMPGWVVAAGQLGAPVLVASLVHILIFGVAACALGKPLLLPAIVLFALTVNVAVFSIENLLFLVYPTRLFQAHPGDFQALARMYLTFLVRFAVLGTAFGLGAGMGAITYWLTGGSWLAAGFTMWLVTALEATALVPCVAWAFRRFDPSTDVPA